jgi:hypothetical protein
MRLADARLRLALLAVLFLPGCLYVSGTGSFGPDLDPEVVARIEAGETTKAGVLSLLGPPDEYLRSEVRAAMGDNDSRLAGAVALGNRAQDAFTYQHTHLKGGGTVLLLYNRLRGAFEADLLVIFFDEADVVREVSFRKVKRR